MNELAPCARKPSYPPTPSLPLGLASSRKAAAAGARKAGGPDVSDESRVHHVISLSLVWPSRRGTYVSGSLSSVELYLPESARCAMLAVPQRSRRGCCAAAPAVCCGGVGAGICVFMLAIGIHALALAKKCGPGGRAVACVARNSPHPSPPVSETREALR